MQKQCPLCGRIYNRWRNSCSDCKTALITANPFALNENNTNTLLNDYYSERDDYRYCPECGEEYYSHIEFCPECNKKLVHSNLDFEVRKDEYTIKYWADKKSWEVLNIPKTYQEGFELVRYLRDNDIEALAAFEFENKDLAPIIFQDLDRLEMNFAYRTIENDVERLRDGRNPYPKLVIIIDHGYRTQAEEYLNKFNSIFKATDSN